MIRDLRFALRLIASHPWFSAAIVLTLALGIGVNTTVFTLVNAVLFKPLPFPGGERLMTVQNERTAGNRDQMGVSYPDFRTFQENNSTFERLEAVANEGAVMSEQGNPPQRYRMGRVSAGMFDMLRTPPIAGRGFRPDDGQPGAEGAVLISHRVWTERYGSSPGAVNRAVRVHEKPATIIGVMPQGFRFPNQEDVWMPLVPTEQWEARDKRSLMLIGIMKPGTTREEAAADLGLIAGRLEKEFPETNEGIGVDLKTFHERYNGGEIRLVFSLMMAAVGLVLLIACANVANMMLGRALGRQREVSIRAALGASRWRIVRQLLTESITLSLLGGVFGLGLTMLGTRAFDLTVANVGKPYWIDFSIDYVVFAYFAAIAIFSGLLFGLAPAMQTSRVDLNRALKDGGRSGLSLGGGRLSAGLVVLQFTLAVVLLAAAGLFMRGFMEHQALNAWVPAERILAAGMVLPERYSEDESRIPFHEQLLANLAALPGVTDAAMVSRPPGSGAATRWIDVEGEPPLPKAERPAVSLVVQTPGYFDLINLPLLAGRDFDERDGTPGREAAVVSRQFAERFWPGDDAVGKRFRFHEDGDPGPWITVIGLCGDIVQEPNKIAPNPLMFVSFRQEKSSFMELLVRAGGDPAALANDVRSQVQRLDRDLPLFDVATLPEKQARSRWYLRVFGTLFFVFALIALVMAAVGIYAVMAQATGRRTQEIAVRMALGASAGAILTMVLRRGLLQLVLGLALGMAGAFAATRLMGELLFRVSPTDPLVFAAIPLLLVAVGLFACWLPARRAAAMHPAKALRCD